MFKCVIYVCGRWGADWGYNTYDIVIMYDNVSSACIVYTCIYIIILGVFAYRREGGGLFEWKAFGKSYASEKFTNIIYKIHLRKLHFWVDDGAYKA